MKRLSRFKEDIENLTGTLADFGEDSIILRYDAYQQDKKEKDVGLLLHEGWEINPTKFEIEIPLVKHEVGMGEVRYSRN